jgi:hypothetical protein
MDDEAAKLYKINSVPKYFLVDKQGILRFSFDTSGDSLADAAKQLLRE